ncbi:MAG: MgtC/SapB family protein [Chloroflexi bacterium]|nr:MgtC/SapB family protein [Chloroflexota bacterium]
MTRRWASSRLPSARSRASSGTANDGRPGLPGGAALRLVVASVLGAVIGLEREIHSHPAGMRTQLLVALGSAMFTVLSVHGFSGFLGPGGASNYDPTRIAAQIVSGIGFLGAGAILHYGLSIKGLTTAASLWATAAAGMAVGAREYVLAVVGTAIVLFSLGPLSRIAARLHPEGQRPTSLAPGAGQTRGAGRAFGAHRGHGHGNGRQRDPQAGKGPLRDRPRPARASAHVRASRAHGDQRGGGGRGRPILGGAGVARSVARLIAGARGRLGSNVTPSGGGQ